MDPPNPSFADEFSGSQEYAVLVLDVRRAVVSLPFQVCRLHVLIKAGLIAFSNASFEFAYEILEETQHGSLTNLPKLFANHLHGLSKVAIVEFCGHLLASFLCFHAAFISASTPGPTHQPCASCGRLEFGASSAAVESMASAMSLAMSLMQLSSEIGGSVATITFATWHLRFSHQPPDSCFGDCETVPASSA